MQKRKYNRPAGMGDVERLKQLEMFISKELQIAQSLIDEL